VFSNVLTVLALWWMLLNRNGVNTVNSQFYSFSTAVFTAALVCITSGSILFTATLVGLTSSGGIYRRISIVQVK